MLRAIKTKRYQYFVDEQHRYQGEYKEWSLVTGKLVEHCFYINDNFHGEYNSWYEHGTQSFRCTYIDDKIQGEYKSWYNNGQLRVHCIYVNNIMHGEFKSFWSDGRIQEHCFCVDDDPKSFMEIPYPDTPEDRIYFKMKYDLQLLPVEN